MMADTDVLDKGGSTASGLLTFANSLDFLPTLRKQSRPLNSVDYHRSEEKK
jgi:hypothetical protein